MAFRRSWGGKLVKTWWSPR